MHGFSAVFGALIGFLASMAPQVWDLIFAHFGPPPPDETAKYTLLQSQQDTIAKQQDTIAKLTANVRYPILNTVLKCLQTSVRPIVTYSIFIVWAAIKLAALHHGMVVEHAPVVSLLPMIWDEDSEALFATIICFWFGSRQMSTHNAKKK